MLASHRKISEAQAYEIEMAEDSSLRQKASFYQLMSAQA
ncbi:protein FAR1-RELATED SEQUENCE 5, partial [Trifolium medium]|nr:protein FAR1-RELATED SEQUENCE 5 [Trifolium medium]